MSKYENVYTVSPCVKCGKNSLITTGVMTVPDNWRTRSIDELSEFAKAQRALAPLSTEELKKRTLCEKCGWRDDG